MRMQFVNLSRVDFKDSSRVTNDHDFVPIGMSPQKPSASILLIQLASVPGRFLGFHHSAGEKHINAAGTTWYACSGMSHIATSSSQLLIHFNRSR